jgi:hypothetical protein
MEKNASMETHPEAANEGVDHEARLGRALLRHGVDSIRASRPACVVCSRRPLVGEFVTIFAGRSDQCVCSRCLETKTARKLGQPVGRHLVRPDAGTVTLRRAA